MKRGIIVLLILLVACAAKTAPTPEQKPVVMEEIKIVEDTTMPAKPMYEPPPTGPTDADVEVKIEAKRYEFLPDEVIARQGNKVRLIITAQDVPHTFEMPSYNIKEDLPVGEDVVIEFVADKKGDFTFSCGVEGHEGQGMKGKLHVV